MLPPPAPPGAPMAAEPRPIWSPRPEDQGADRSPGVQRENCAHHLNLWDLTMPSPPACLQRRPARCHPRWRKRSVTTMRRAGRSISAGWRRIANSKRMCSMAGYRAGSRRRWPAWSRPAAEFQGYPRPLAGCDGTAVGLRDQLNAAKPPQPRPTQRPRLIFRRSPH